MRKRIQIFGFFSIFLIFLSSALSAEETVQLLPYKRQLLLNSLTRPIKELTIAGEVSGRCIEVLVDLGDTVTSTGVVAELDRTFVKLDLEKNEIAQQKASRQLELEKKTLSRYTTLIKSNSAAQATFDEATLRADIHKLTLDSLKNEEIRLGEVLKRHSLKGPSGWEVVERLVEPGEFVRQGEPVLRLGNFKKLLVSFMLTYEELGLLRQMDRITLYLEEIGQEVEGKIHQVAPDFDEKSRKIPVDLIIARKSPSLDAGLRGGLRVQLTIDGKEEADTFVIPFSALTSRYEANWLVTADGQRKKVILLGKSGDGQDAIVAGSNLIAGQSFLAFPDLLNQ